MRETVPVSVIVPTFNRAGYLREAIGSILGGTVVPADVIVVDDGSTDATADMVRSFGAGVRYVRQDNGGKSAALNRGLTHVDQPLVWIFDDDDLARTDALERLHETLSRHPQADIGYGRYELFWPDGESGGVRRQLVAPPPAGETLHLALLERCTILQPAMLVRTSCYRAIGPFDTTLRRSQDYDMLLRLTRRHAAVEIDAVLYDQRQHDAPRMPSGTGESQSRTQLWRTYDRVIFEKIFATYPIGEFLPPWARDRAGARARALVRRSGLMGRRGLWDHAEADLRDLAQIGVEAAHVDHADIAVFAVAFAADAPGLASVDLSRIWRRVGTIRPLALRRALRKTMVKALGNVARSRIRERYPEMHQRLRTIRTTVVSGRRAEAPETLPVAQAAS